MNTEHSNIKILGDGNCLFRAFSYFLYNTQEKHRNVRLKIVSYILSNWDFYQPFIIGDESYNQILLNQNAYKVYMSTDSKYGGEVEIQAFVNKYNIYVEVHHRIFNNKQVYGQNTNNNKLILLLSGTIDCGHYDILNCLNNSYLKFSE